MKSAQRTGLAAAALAALGKSQAPAAAATAQFRNQLGLGWATQSIALANAASSKRVDAPGHDTVLLLRA